MNKILKILISAVFICLVVFVQKTTAEDWSSVYDGYQEAEYGKIISDQDYKNAINAFKEYNKPDKKVEKKLKEKGLNLKNNEEEETKIIFEAPARQEPLLMLPVNVSYDGKQIHQGFYLAKPLIVNDKYFIRLSQGRGQVIADIEASVFKSDNMQKVAKNKKKIFSEMKGQDLVKITYSSREFILEAFLFVN